MKPYPYDPAKAKQLLAEAGYPNGFEIEFDAFTGSIADHSKAAEAVAEFLRKVGITVKLNMMEFGTFGPRRIGDQAAPLFIYSFGNRAAEPAYMVKWMMQGQASLFYHNAEILALLDKAEVTFDAAARRQVYAEIQRKLREDAGFIFLFQADQVFAMQKQVEFEPRQDEMFDLYTLSSKT